MPSEMPEQTFAERLRLAMDARGLNANQLAIRAGVAPAYFATAFKRNTRTVSQDQAKKLAPALGVRVAWLMSGDPPTADPSQASATLWPRARVVMVGG